tara:strand:- start:401 stop:610 length:210 start_codon:yes stop_codon:yes gene_type:complete
MKLQHSLILNSRELKIITELIHFRINNLSAQLTQATCNPDEFKLSAQKKALYQIEHRDLKNLITAFETT